MTKNHEHHALTAENVLSALPQVLREDDSMYALAQSIGDVLAGRATEIDTLRIYAVIDSLPEELLDIIAYDFKVDWWDYSYTVEQKRQTLKDSFMVHKHLGTKWAVETAISAIYPGTKVQEWFERGGDPYTFWLQINASGQTVDLQRHARVIELANFYKNLRSHLRGVEYTVEAKETPTLYMGGQLGSVVTFGLPQIADTFIFDGPVRMGGHMATITTITMPEPQM